VKLLLAFLLVILFPAIAIAESPADYVYYSPNNMYTLDDYVFFSGDAYDNPAEHVYYSPEDEIMGIGETNHVPKDYAFTAPSIHYYDKGDVTQSGEINVRDVVWTVQYILDLRDFNDTQRYLADMNHFGLITVDDVVLMYRIVLDK